MGSLAPAQLSLNDSEVVTLHYLFVQDLTYVLVRTTSEGLGGGSGWVQVILHLE